MPQHPDIHASPFGGKDLVLFPESGEIPVDLHGQVHIDGRFVARPLQRCHDAFQRRMAGSQGQGGHIAIHQVRHAPGGMGMEVDGQRHLLTDGGDHIRHLFRGHHAGHIFHMDGTDAQGLEIFGHLHIFFYRMDRRNGVADVAFCLFPVLQHGFDGRFRIPDIVQSVEHQEDVDAGLRRQFHKLFHDIIRILHIANQVLTPQQHPQRRVRAEPLERPDPVPGIFAQIPDHHIERGTAPHFHTAVPHTVHLGQDGQHVLRFDASGQKRLLAVPPLYTGDLDGLFFSCFCCFFLFPEKHDPSFLSCTLSGIKLNILI